VFDFFSQVSVIDVPSHEEKYSVSAGNIAALKKRLAFPHPSSLVLSWHFSPLSFDPLSPPSCGCSKRRGNQSHGAGFRFPPFHATVSGWASLHKESCRCVTLDLDFEVLAPQVSCLFPGSPSLLHLVSKFNPLGEPRRCVSHLIIDGLLPFESSPFCNKGRSRNYSFPGRILLPPFIPFRP